MSNFLILGASRGLGEALGIGLPDVGDYAFLVSRTRPNYLLDNSSISRQWIEADLSNLTIGEMIASQLDNKAIDVCIFNAGIWETEIFNKTTDSEIKAIIDTNLTAVLLVIKHLLPNIKSSTLRKVIFIGSTAGLDNSGSTSVAYTASKFGLRGAAHALREILRPDGVAVTCINPGGMATDIEFALGSEAALKSYKNSRIPVNDIVQLVKTIIKLSPASCVKEVDMPALADGDV